MKKPERRGHGIDLRPVIKALGYHVPVADGKPAHSADSLQTIAELESALRNDTPLRFFYRLRHLHLHRTREAALGALLNGFDLESCSRGEVAVLREMQLEVARNRHLLRSGQSIHKHMDLQDFGTGLVTCTAAGWLPQVRRVHNAVLPFLALGGFYDAQPDCPHPARRCLAWFVMKLLADWSDVPWPAQGMPPHPYPAPPYDALLAHWRHPSADAIAPLLIDALDWHRAEARMDRSNDWAKQKDFQNAAYTVWPVEVHMLFRLRDSLGLPNPLDLDHPLMRTPLAVYTPEPWPVPHDDLLERVTARALREYPELAELL